MAGEAGGGCNSASASRLILSLYLSWAESSTRPPPHTLTHTHAQSGGAVPCWTTGGPGSNDFTAADLTEGGCSVSDEPGGSRSAHSQNMDIKV